jgi:hypothetical protein
LNKFSDLDALPDNPAAAAAKVDALDYFNSTDLDHAIVATLYQPDGGYQDSDILNIEMSLDIFGPSTTELLTIDARHPTLGFEFYSSHPTDDQSSSSVNREQQRPR